MRIFPKILHFNSIFFFTVDSMENAVTVNSIETFIFGLNTFHSSYLMQKFEVRPERNYRAIMWHSNGKLIFGQQELTVDLDTPRVHIGIENKNLTFTTPTVGQPNEAFTGSSSFKPDDVEVFINGGRLSVTNLSTSMLCKFIRLKFIYCNNNNTIIIIIIVYSTFGNLS